MMMMMMIMVMMILMTMLAKMMMITSQNDVQVHFNEAIRKAVEEKDRRIQELELSLSSQVIAMHIYACILVVILFWGIVGETSTSQ